MSSEPVRPVQAEDLFRFRFLQDAKLSPDGRSVAYVVGHIGPNGDEKEADLSTIYLLWLESGQSRPLTAGSAADTAPDWSPDGREIAFLSTRSGKPQIYRIAVDGGEAQAVTHLEQGVGGGPVWSPDGTTFAFTATRAQPIDYSKPYRVTRHIYRFNDMGYLDNALQDVYLIPAEGGEPRLLVHNDCMNSAPQWSPDGKEILYSISMFPDTHRLVEALAVVDLEGRSRMLVKDWGEASQGRWLPGGKVAFVGTPAGRLIGSKSDLWVIDAQGGEPECRTASLLYPPGSLQADMPAGAIGNPQFLVQGDRTAFLPVQKGGNVEIYRVALQGAEAFAPVVTGERSCMPVGVHENRLVFAASQLLNPNDLYAAQTDGSQEQRLTHLNADLLVKFKLPQVEHLSFKAVDGVNLEGWFMKPPEGQAPYPTVLYIHGGPHSGFGNIFSFDFHLLAGAGFGVLFLNQRGSTGYGDDFANQILGDWGNLDYRDLMAGVDHAVTQGLSDPDRLGVCGLSGGGNLSCWIVGQTDRFKAAVPENPVTNWVSMYGVSDIGAWFGAKELDGKPHQIPDVYARCSPITYAHNCKTPTLLIQGEADWRCPAEQSEQFYTVLKAEGCPVEMLRLPNSSHAASINGPVYIRRAQNEALLDWMQRYLLGK